MDFNFAGLLQDDEEDDIAVAAAVVEEINGVGDGDEQRGRVFVNVEGWRELSNISFKENFRLDRTVFHRLIVAVGHHLTATGRLHRIRTSLDLCLLMGLWTIFNQDTYRSTAHHFGVDKSVVHFHYRYIIEVLRELAPKYVKWPTAIERDIIKGEFENRYGYPGVVGCMDGVAIEVTAPLEQPRRYKNRHDSYSILVQAVCDHNLIYRNLYVGEAGSIGDRRMFDRSPLSNNLLLRPDMMANGEHILADGAYPLTKHVMIPYIDDRNTTPRQRHHNYVLSSARATVERSFARLRGKHRRLKKLPMRNHDYLIDHTISAFVLHNFILLEGHEADGLPPQEMPVAANVGQLEELVEEAKADGAIKREYIAQLLHQ